MTVTLTFIPPDTITPTPGFGLVVGQVTFVGRSNHLDRVLMSLKNTSYGSTGDSMP